MDVHYVAIAQGLVASSIIGGLLSRFVGRWMKRQNKVLVDEYFKELRPNGGSSLHDTVTTKILPLLEIVSTDVTALKTELTGVKVNQGKLEGRFEQFVDDRHAQDLRH